MPDRPALQRLILRTVLGLPAPLLRLISGGGVVYQGGRTLDPRLQFLASQSRAAPPMTSLAPEEARRVNAEGVSLFTGAGAPDVHVEAISIPRSGDGQLDPIPARMYRPAAQASRAPLMIFAHMGGGVIGDLETCHAFCSRLAATTRGPVLSVDYRLAPDHRFPAGLDDVLEAYRWGRANAARFGAPAGMAAIGGDSMGGNFAAVICQLLKAADEAQPVLQLLIYPCVDVASESASMTTYGEAFPLTRAMMDWFMGHYLGPGDNPADPRLSPLRSGDLSSLAPAVVVTAGFDPLHDQGEAYARRLKAAGVPTVYRCYDSLSHAFTAFTGAVPAADAACREIADLVRDDLEGRIRP